MRRLAPPLLPVLALVALVAAPATATAQTPAKPADPTAKELGDKTDALSKQAAELVEAYKKAISARIQQIGQENPPLARLVKAGVFGLGPVLAQAGVQPDLSPLEQLPAARKAYEELDQTAQRYMTEFGGKAKATAEEQAVDFLRKVIKAQVSYREDDKDGNGILDYAPGWAELIQSGLLTLPTYKKGDSYVIVNGYRFRIITADLLTWAADAGPVTVQDGTTFLYVDQSNKVRAEKGKAAGPLSPEWKPPAE